MPPSKNKVSQPAPSSISSSLLPLTFMAILASALALLPFLLSKPTPARAQAPTWCGKYYEEGSSPINPGGQFQAPLSSSVPLLNFQCAPVIRPYLSPDDTYGAIIIDAGISRDVGVPFYLPRGTSFLVDVITDDGTKLLSYERAVSGEMGQEFTIAFDKLAPRATPYNLTCTATFPSGTQLTSTDKLAYLPPNPYGGSTTKYDVRTGATLVKSPSSSTWEPIFPLGFYTSFGGYIEYNLSALDNMAAKGFNLVHPVPTFDNLTALSLVIDRMEELGLWLMYDMRWNYMNGTSVEEQVNMIKNRSNLLLWYTGDEPDGTSDPLNATSQAYDLIYSLDGYHPVSLVLNCQNYYWTEYTSGADIIMEDPYPIGINATFSTVWNTPCTPELGDCGCDNCVGNYTDIVNRVDTFAQRTRWTYRERNLTTWHVPQAFGIDTYWPRYPTGQEWLVQSALAINHGAHAIVPWDEPTSNDIEASASLLALHLSNLTSFIFDPSVKLAPIATSATVDIASWTTAKGTLIMAVNMEYNSTEVMFPSYAHTAQPVFTSGGSLDLGYGKATVTLDSIGVVAYVLH